MEKNETYLDGENENKNSKDEKESFHKEVSINNQSLTLEL